MTPNKRPSDHYLDKLEQIQLKIEPVEVFNQVLIELLDRYTRKTKATSKKIAFILGITPSTLSQWKSGKRFPAIQDVCLLAYRLGFDITEKTLLVYAHDCQVRLVNISKYIDQLRDDIVRREEDGDFDEWIRGELSLIRGWLSEVRRVAPKREEQPLSMKIPARMNAVDESPVRSGT